MKDFFENLLSNGELQEKVAELQGKIDAYQMSENKANEIIAELKAENDRLKEEIKEVKKYQYEQEFLEKEIEEQREKNKRLTCKILEVKALNETLNVQCTSQDCTQLRKLHQTLQEIKAIAERAFAVCDDDCGNANKFKEIIELTKAEEE